MWWKKWKPDINAIKEIIRLINRYNGKDADLPNPTDPEKAVIINSIETELKNIDKLKKWYNEERKKNVRDTIFCDVAKVIFYLLDTENNLLYNTQGTKQKKEKTTLKINTVGDIEQCTRLKF